MPWQLGAAGEVATDGTMQDGGSGVGLGVGVGLQHSPTGGSSDGGRGGEGGAGGDAEGDAGGRLVGRESELAALETALTSLLEQRRGGVILLTGEYRWRKR